MAKKVIVTGASGLLGRAVSANLSAGEPFDVQPWIYTRGRGDSKAKKVNIADKDEVFKAIEEFKPDAIVHCAAIRAPDIVDKQTEFARSINVLGSQYVAVAAAACNAKLIYISTDYVFDGRNPPYAENAAPNPLNEYGRQKLDGEKAALRHYPHAVVLRVPLLYGPVEFLGEGAVDILLKNILRKDAQCEMSHYERRYPTHVGDVASAIRLLLEKHLKNSTGADDIKGIFHWSGDEELTKYGMCKVISEVFSLSIDHLIPTSDAPPSMSAVQRPYNSQLSCQRLIDLGARNKYCFKSGIAGALRNFIPKN